MSRHDKFMTENEVETVRRAIGSHIASEKSRAVTGKESYAPRTESEKSVFYEALAEALDIRFDEQRREHAAAIAEIRNELRDAQLTNLNLRIDVAEFREQIITGKKPPRWPTREIAKEKNPKPAATTAAASSPGPETPPPTTRRAHLN
jgi:hypothetical protein